MKIRFVKNWGLLGLLLVTTPTFAGLWGIAEIKAQDSILVYRFYDEPALMPGCTGKNVNSLVVNFKNDDQVIEYGRGCWVLGLKGEVHVWVKRENGELRKSMISITRIVFDKSKSK